MLNRTKIHKFKNGATLIYKRRKLLDATAVNAGFFVGHYYHEDIPGLPHFAEHMLFKGTNKRTYDQILEDRSNITFLNAYTSNYFLVTEFFESNKRVEKCFEFASDVLLNTKLDESKIENEKKVVFEERARAIDSAKKNINAQHFRYMEKEALNEDLTFGTPEILGKATIQDVQNFLNKHFVSDKFIISVVSSLPFNKIKKLTKKYFIKNLKIVSTPSKILDFKYFMLENKEGVNLVKNQDKSLNVKISFKYNVDNGLDYKYDYNLDCVSTRMQARKDSYHNMARKNGYLYSSVNGNNYNECSNVMTYDFCFTTSSIENMENIFNLIGDNIKKFKKDFISQEEIDLYIENAIIRQDKSFPSRYLDNIFSNLLKFYKYGKIEKRTKKQIIKDYKKVNKADIEKNINIAFNKQNKVYITIMGDIDESQIKTLKEYKKMLFK